MMLDDLTRQDAAGPAMVEAGPAACFGRMIQAHIRIAGTGIHTPEMRRSSADIDRDLGHPMGTTEKRTGIRERPIAGPQSSSFMATQAARAALAAADLPATGLDMIISACSVPEQPIPAMAPLIQARLGLDSVRHPSLQRQCQLPQLRDRLRPCRPVDRGEAGPQHPRRLLGSPRVPCPGGGPDTAALFGDGAAAAIVSAANGTQGGLLASHMES